MKRAIAVSAIAVTIMLCGCANFWTNYYAIQPGTTTATQVEKLLGEPYVKGDGEWVVRPPKTKEGKEVQYINIYFDENGIVTGAKRVNPAKEPPMSPDGTLNREETMGTIPGITANKQTVRAKSK